MLLNASLLAAVGAFVLVGEAAPNFANVASGETAEPEGMVEMQIVDVVSAEDGELNAVLLMPESQDVLLPVFVGLDDAVGIAARLKDEAPPFPAAADFFEGFLKEFDSKVERVVIDTVVPSSLNGTVFLTHGDQKVQLPCRASELIALAIAHKVPIYVSNRVTEEVGLTEKDIENIERGMPPGEGPGIGGSGEETPPGHPPVEKPPKAPGDPAAEPLTL